MLKTGRLFMGILAVMLAASSAVYAKEGKGPHDPQKRLDHLTKKLELTPEQRAQVEHIMTEYRGRIEALQDQMESLKQEKHDKINATLTPEQQEKFQKMKDKKESGGWRKKQAG